MIPFKVIGLMDSVAPEVKMMFPWDLLIQIGNRPWLFPQRHFSCHQPYGCDLWRHSPKWFQRMEALLDHLWNGKGV